MSQQGSQSADCTGIPPAAAVSYIALAAGGGVYEPSVARAACLMCLVSLLWCPALVGVHLHCNEQKKVLAAADRLHCR